MPELLAIRGLNKTFPGTRALDRVDFDLRRGEVHALIGQNGSGKSTLIKVLAGFHAPDPGAEIELDGDPVDLYDAVAAGNAGFRFVHQDLGLVADLNTVENLALGQGFQTAFGGRIRWRAEARDARLRLQALGYDFDVQVPVRELGAAQRTGIAIARALHHWEEAKVLVVDEPTASLPRHEVAVLFEAIRRVSARGLGVIYVSHRLDEIFDIADRVTVLRDGHKVATVPTAETDQDELIALMVGDEELKPPRTRRAMSDEVVLEARSICGIVVDNIDIEARAGEVVGIAGFTGSGREEILPLLFGAVSRHGDVSVRGTSVTAGRPEAAKQAGIALVPAERHAQGCVTSMTLRENCTLTDLKRHTTVAALLRRSHEDDEVREWIERLGVRPARPDALFATLSGGNQQKIVLAKWLRIEPQVLLLDEPTQGVDVGAKATIHDLAREAAEGGAAVVIASSDDAELLDTCDRILVMRDGHIVASVPAEGMSLEKIAQLQLAGT